MKKEKEKECPPGLQLQQFARGDLAKVEGVEDTLELLSGGAVVGEADDVSDVEELVLLGTQGEEPGSFAAGKNQHHVCSIVRISHIGMAVFTNRPFCIYLQIAVYFFIVEFLIYLFILSRILVVFLSWLFPP